MTTNTIQRELIYLAALLHDKRLHKMASVQPIANLISKQLLAEGIDWLPQLLRMATAYAVGKLNSEYFIPDEKQRLQSVFASLYGRPMQPQTYFFNMQRIRLQESFFPEKQSAQPERALVDDPWQPLDDEIKAIATLPPAKLAESLLYLLETHLVTVPTGIVHLPDVSLFDHLKSTAAIALCLYDYIAEVKTVSLSDIHNDDEPLLLVGGDLSGIQAFIYDIIGRSAAKNLKGRSFYLQLLVDTIVQYLLDGLKLRQANVVYSSGGGFYLLAPNTTFVRDTLPSLQKTIARQLRDEHGVRLFLAIDCQPISQGQLFEQTINEGWFRLTEKLSTQKGRRFADYLLSPDGYTYFFEPSEAGGESRGNRDAVTSEEFSLGERRYRMGHDDDNDARMRVRRSTFEQIRLGRTLRENIQYMVVSKRPIAGWKYDRSLFGERVEAYFQPLALGYYYYFINKDEREKLLKQVSSVDDALILSVNEVGMTDFRLSGKQQTYGFTFYGGNDLPRDENQDAKYFEDLCGPPDLNFKRLGILRMDVDNLGHIFKTGFDAQSRTFSRYSTLSRSLDYFFKGYLNYLWGANKDFKKYTFILYAGGDDLFIIGKWDVTLRFAEKIQQEFARWTCYNPRLGLSGGIAIVPPKFPIAKAAEQSDREEKLAKDHQHNGRDKNSMSLLGTPLAWGEEWTMVTRLKNDLIRFIGAEKSISKSLLSKIGSLHSMKQEQEKNSRNPSWRWIAAYDLGRATERIKSTEAKAFYRELQTDLFTNRTYKGRPLQSLYTFLDLLNVAARWAELEMRSQEH